MMTTATVFTMTVVANAALAAALVTSHDDDGTITVNGKRTLIVGSYYAGAGPESGAPTLETYKGMAQAGFNLVRAGAATRDLAHQAGLMTWDAVGTLNLEEREKSEAALRERVAAIKDHPSLAFIESEDEPAWTWKKAEPRIPPEPFVEAYPIIKEMDPNHLLYMNHAPTNLVKTLLPYNKGTDIVACDIYPVNPGGLREQYALFADGYQGDLNNIYISQVGQYAAKMRTVAGPNRPVFMVLQAFAWEMLRKETDRQPEKVLYPSYEDSRFMAYQALINTANGIIYWGSGYTPADSQCWTDIKRVVREIADLADVLVERSTSLPITIDYHEVGHSVDFGVQMLAKIHQGKLYLFTCNADKNPCKATISGLGDWAACDVLNESRTLPLENGAITDTWAPFAVHVYAFSRG